MCVPDFQLFGDAMCKYSEECPNAIVHASLIPKQDIQVMWKAPQAGTGCVVFKWVIVGSLCFKLLQLDSIPGIDVLSEFFPAWLISCLTI